MAVQRSFRNPTTTGVARRRRERHAPPGPPASAAAPDPGRERAARELCGAAVLELEPGDLSEVDREVSQR